MRSTPTSSRHRPPPGHTHFTRQGRSFPATDCCFQTSSPAGTGALPRARRASELRKFRKLSSEFFGSETSRSYAREAGLFGLITIISAWPIVSMIRELGRLLK